jgi:cytochrome b subunit of formate dehydrogenase
MTIPSELFTISSFATLAGCTAIVYIVTGVTGYLVNFQTSQTIKKWVSIGLSMIVAFVAASLTEDKTAYTWILAVFNGFLIFFAATGTNAIFANKETTETKAAVATISTASKSTPKTNNTSSTEKSNDGETKQQVNYKVVTTANLGLKADVSSRRGKFSDKWW